MVTLWLMCENKCDIEKEKGLNLVISTVCNKGKSVMFWNQTSFATERTLYKLSFNYW